ncbi:hypothetical protein [Rufibacter roseus]|nr:hypothetical protein [Rufibacter roseus]
MPYKSQIFTPIITGILLGLLVGTTSVFEIFFLIIITGFVVVGRYLIVLADKGSENIKSDERLLKLLRMTSRGLVCAVITSIAAINFFTHQRQLQAERIVPIFEEYYELNSKYPQSISDLRDIDKSTEKNLYYRTDSTRQSFYLSYLVNGVYSKSYRSEEKSWILNVD